MSTLVDTADKENNGPAEQQQQSPDRGFASWQRSHGMGADNRHPTNSLQQRQLNRFVGNFPLYTADMGIQSQLCNGSVKKCKKQGARVKRQAKHIRLSRMNVSSSSPYVVTIHCERCRLNKLPEPWKKWALKKHKDAHDDLCPLKLSNKRKAIQTNTMRNYIDGAGTLVTTRTGSTSKAIPPVNIIAGSVGYNIQNLNSMAVEGDFVSDMKLEMDARMEKLKDGVKEFVDMTARKQAPAVIILAVDMLLSQFKHKRKASPDSLLPNTKMFREAHAVYSDFFPIHTAIFTFPEDTTGKPSPAYHCLAGQQIMYLDWQLCFPGTALPCPKCGRGFLIHKQTNFMKNKGNLFPIWNQDGSIIWSVIMKYQCTKCQDTIDGNDGRLLQLLPAHMAAAYPVPPRFATETGGFHLHKDAIQFLEHMLMTYGNGDQFSIFLLRSLADRYLEKARTYLSQSPTKPFPNFFEFTNKKWPPNGQSLRDLYKTAENSTLTPYDYSQTQRYSQEIRTVRFEEGDTAAFDHTFAAVRAYKDKSSLGIKCIADMNNGRTGEIAGVWCVPSGKLKDVSHALTQAMPRLKNMSVITTDTMPHGLVFWRATLGDDIVGRLGLFHFLHRIMETLDHHCEHYWDCILKLQDSIYIFNKTDWENLKNALANGTLGGEKLTEEEIDQLRHSKRFKQRYDKFLRKEFHSEENICYYLNNWIKSWEDVTDSSNRKVFTWKTVDVANEQLKKVKYVLDCEKAANYVALPSKGDHGLTEWKCLRAEPSLEKFHELLAHFTNVGLTEELANALFLRGTADYNVGARWRYECNAKRRGGEVLEHPKYMDDKPIFMDHSLLHHINQQSRQLGFGNLFEDYRVPEVGNENEKFFSEYCKEQIERNKKEGIVADSKVCLCDDCKDKYEKPQSVARGGGNLLRMHEGVPYTTVVPAQQPRALRPPISPPATHCPPVNFLPQPAPLMHPTTQTVPLQNPYNYPMNPINFFAAKPISNQHYLNDHCYLSYPYYCQPYKNYKNNPKKRGKPPHDPQCPKRMGFNYSQHLYFK